MKALLLLLSFVSFALCVYHSNVVLRTENSGIVQPNQIYYSPTYFSLFNIENPLTVQVEFETGDADSQANICLAPNQANFPVPGNNAANACPVGGFVQASNVTNTTTQSTKLKFTRMMKDSVRGQLLSKMVEDTAENGAVDVYGQPAQNSAGFVVTTTSTTNTSFTITLIGSYCDPPEFAVNGSCVPANALNTDGTGNTGSVPAGTWGYFTFNSAAFDPTKNNQINIAYNVSTIYVQQGYLPTDTWNIGVAEESPQVINTPGVTGVATPWYVAIDNTASAADLAYSLNVTFAGCGAQLVGPGCAVNTTASNSTMDGSVVVLLDANLDSNNNGDAISFDLSDDDYAFVYFQLYNLPVFPEGYPYYVRVSIGNNELEDDEDNFAPTLYAKLSGYPSAESYDYAVGGAVANQVILKISSAEDLWYLAVPTPADFSIWVGVNCAGNCNDEAHGSCSCSATSGTGATVSCSAIANSTDYYALYASLPTSTSESAGSCDCSDDDYAESFDCSQKSSPTVLFIVLIVIGGLIILFVAIGVPLYCYISNKRKERYERI